MGIGAAGVAPIFFRYIEHNAMPIIRTSDGSHTVLSEQYGVTYHSRHGAVTESAHIFINAGLRYKAAVQREIAILETGFGTGLNGFMTWLEADRRNLNVHYTALELFPVSMEYLVQFDYSTALNVSERQPDFVMLHETAWEQAVALNENFTLEKRRETIEFFRRPDSFDLIYFDAFAPQAQPELWTVEVLANMYESLRPDGVLVTYCAQGAFKRNLKKVGFTVERLQGPPGKREMTRGNK